MTIFEYTDYKKFLQEHIHNQPYRGRGLRLKLAQYLNCQTAYISQVLNKYTHFSMEQSLKVAEFFELNASEREFFLLLVQMARAGTKELENFHRNQIEDILENRKDLANRLNIKNQLDEMNQHIYYSVWYYAAIHILTSIPEFQKPKNIATKLGLSLSIVTDALEFLMGTGLVIKESERFVIGKTQIHLSQKSVQIRRHHQNWRNKAINSIDENRQEDLHYSNVISMGEDDIPKVYEILLQAIDDCRKVIRSSPEEELQILTLDFFRL